MPKSSSKTLSNVLKPVNQSTGLPNSHYINKEIFNIEKEQLLFKKWCGVGFGKDIPKIGDVVPITFLGLPLLLVRDQFKKVRVFQNTCRHRGMILIQKKTNVRGTIRCPYHSWCYGLTGNLRATPHVGGPGINIHKNIIRSQLGLYEINSHLWQDVIFINISGSAPPFEQVNAKLLDRWSEFNQPLSHSGSDSSLLFEVNCNWKLAVENYCESYHLPWVHPGLNSYSRLEDHYNIQETGCFSGQGSYVYKRLKGKNDLVFDDFSNLSDRWKTGSEYISLFPNVLLGVHCDHTIAVLLQPISTKKTLERIEIYYASQTSLLKKYSKLRKRNKLLWKDIFREDISVVEGMQKGRSGILFDGGKFSPVMDFPTHVFHQWVASNYMKSDRENS